MAYNPKTWSADELITSGKLNQCKETFDWLYGRFLPILGQNRVAKDTLAFFLVDFSGANQINPANGSGTGAAGASWSKIQLVNNAFLFQVTIPSGIFSSAVIPIACQTGSAAQWGITVCSVWDETPTAFKVAVVDTGGPQYPINSTFAFWALLLGTRAGGVS